VGHKSQLNRVEEKILKSLLPVLLFSFLAALRLEHVIDLSDLVVHDLLLLLDLVSKNGLKVISLAVHHDDFVE